MTKLIKFGTPECASCVTLSNHLNDLGIKVDEEIHPFDNPELAGEYNIGSIPVLILEDDNGNEVKRSIGFKPNEIEEMIEQL